MRAIMQGSVAFIILDIYICPISKYCFNHFFISILTCHNQLIKSKDHKQRNNKNKE